MKIAVKNARALLNRTRDGKIFRGWILDFTPDRLQAIVQTKVAVEPGEQFVISIFGHPHQCSVPTSLVSSTATALYSGGADGTFLFDLSVGNPITLQRLVEEPRYRVEGIQMEYQSQVQCQCFTSELVDIGQSGFSIVSSNEFAVGQMMEIGLHTGMNEITASVEVRNHRRIESHRDRFRTGFQIVSMDRGGSLRWQELFGSVVARNSVEIDVHSGQRLSA